MNKNEPLPTDNTGTGKLGSVRVEPMTNYMAISIAEGYEDAESEEQWLEAWQHLVDTGLAWTLQGWFGRSAQHLIETGRINNG
jgi:hypothetical protein